MILRVMSKPSENVSPGSNKTTALTSKNDNTSAKTAAPYFLCGFFYKARRTKLKLIDYQRVKQCGPAA